MITVNVAGPLIMFSMRIIGHKRVPECSCYYIGYILVTDVETTLFPGHYLRESLVFPVFV